MFRKIKELAEVSKQQIEDSNSGVLAPDSTSLATLALPDVTLDRQFCGTGEPPSSLKCARWRYHFLCFYLFKIEKNH